MKRAIAITILVSMVLHCASRLGFISYLYGQRHAIAYTIGLIDEKPIALCVGDYFAEQAPLVIQENQESDQPLPLQAFQAKDINLFVQVLTNTISELIGTKLHYNTGINYPLYPSPDLAVFHPPCTA